ncbi:odorant receptor 9a [Monomorium pharaonis]|uniref:odorant receptor 9a n=1 Tax=Monomorium pharaonis TaxID=307658 RepID=UPI00063F7C82|nr:odorant receptor 9a [Monomorium pharaonis]
MSFFDNHYYYLNKIFLRIIGQWPFQSRLESNLTFVAASLSILTLGALESWGLVAGISNLSIIMDNAAPLLVISIVNIKLYNCVFTRNKMKMLLEDIEETWKMKRSEPEKKILQHYAEESKDFTIRYAIALYAAWLFYCGTPLVITWIDKLLPKHTNETYTARFLYRIEHVLDMDKYYNLLMLHAFIGVFYLLSVLIAIDSIFTVCIQHICALFECIRYNIEQTRTLDTVLLQPNIENDEAYRNLIGCIKSYKHVLKLSHVLSSNYAVSFLFLLGNVVISLSFGWAQFIIVDTQLDEKIRILFGNMTQLLHIYGLCSISQRLINHSCEFQGVIYSCNWYRMSLRSRHFLRFTLLRSMKPCELKAGKVFVMSMEIFSSILKVCLSYITMLTSLQ